MSSQIERVVGQLRERILSGELTPGQHLRELEWAPILGVSRTPLRLALVELEKQGLVESHGVRGGFHVRGVTMDEVVQAIDVRGVLEGYAVRLVAEHGVTPAVKKILVDCVERGRAFVEQAEVEGGPFDGTGWPAINALFHATLVDAAGNHSLRQALDLVQRSPLADASMLLIRGSQPRLELSFLRRSQLDHEDVLQAIIDREGARAEALMREHARRSRDNKKRLARDAARPDASSQDSAGLREALALSGQGVAEAPR